MDSNEVKFVFKTLIKVPCIILISYIIFNLFAFVVSYLRLVSLSYVVQETVIQNNFIPDSEKDILEDYISDNIMTDLLTNIHVEVSEAAIGDISGNPEMIESNLKCQYGTQLNIKIHANFNILNPVVPFTEAEGLDGTGGTAYVPPQRLNIPIVLEYTVPALKYYADLN